MTSSLRYPNTIEIRNQDKDETIQTLLEDRENLLKALVTAALPLEAIAMTGYAGIDQTLREGIEKGLAAARAEVNKKRLPDL